MSRGATLTITSVLVTEECCECGITFAFPEDFKKKKLEEAESGSFYCPNGHGQHYMGRPLKDQLRDAKRQAANAQEDARVAWAEAEQRQRELKAERTKARAAERRAKAAMCPVDGCHRQVQQMARHLRTKHPEYVHAQVGH